MNDVHENNNLEHPFHSALWRKPELFRQGHPDYYARALDFAHVEVRNHYQALINELLERYDLDGLELDFLREPYLFSRGKEQEGRQILTAWLRGIRALADVAAKRRGHAVRLGVRVPSAPDAALGLGLDAPAWAKEGLVDLVVVASRWETLEFDLPLATWRELLGNRVTLAGGLEVNYRPYRAAAPRLVTREEATGAAVAVLTGGADAVYLFNYFQHGHPGWPLSEYTRMLKSFSSLDALLRLPRRHAVTYRDITSLTETYRPPLPACGKRLSFSLPLGPAAATGWKIETTVEVVTPVPEDKIPGVLLNGVAGKLLRSETVTSGGRVLTHAFPVTALSGKERDTIVIAAEGQTSITVQRVEVSIRP